jgi:micrococcal nuclease
VAKKASVLVLLGVWGYLAAAGVPQLGTRASAAPAAASWFTLRGKVTRVVDGDTIHVRIGKKTEKVRLLGIDAPESGGCYSAEAAAHLRRLAMNKTVRLLGDRTQARRDSFKRLLAYVHLPNGKDVEVELLRGGFVTVYVYNNRPFARLARYETAEAYAAGARFGSWASCQTSSTETTTSAPTATTAAATTVLPLVPPTPAPPPAAPANCDPSYPTVCTRPPPPDLDCGDVPYKNFRVLQPDPHRFDGNRDGYGCEG